VVPIHRVEDGPIGEANGAAFARANQLLAEGGLVAIFPEGISHDQPVLQSLRTGSARIALAASASGVGDVAVVVVTLLYDQKQRFRSRALVTVGHPEPVEPWMADYRPMAPEPYGRSPPTWPTGFDAVAPTMECGPKRTPWRPSPTSSPADYR